MFISRYNFLKMNGAIPKKQKPAWKTDLVEKTMCMQCFLPLKPLVLPNGTIECNCLKKESN